MGLSFQKIRKSIPWYVKFSVKIVRGSLPIPYDFFAKLGLFRHGKMDNPDYAIATFENHFPGLIDIPKSPFVFLEIGPGDSLASAIIAYSKGAKKSYLIDSGDYMTKDISKYLNLIEKILGSNFLENKKLENIDHIKKEFNIVQLTEGVSSLKTLPDNIIDISFSNACLEHVACNEVEDLFKELKRVSKPGSISSHFIDYKDHLEYSLNNLRFSKEFWEKNIIKKSGIYTNRMRFFEMKNLIEKAGFKCVITNLGKWDRLPILESKLHADFQSFEKEDLLIKEAWVRLT
jgi:SAM-dependent methyltransferase